MTVVMWVASSGGLLFQSLALLFLLLSLSASAQEFNYEVEKRIVERLHSFLAEPVATNQMIANFRENGGFANNMEAADRNLYLALAYSVSQPLVYYGLEDGTCPGYDWSNGFYREPGNSGFAIDNPAMEKHLKSCLDRETGAPKDCLLASGAEYISCQDGLGDVTGVCERVELCPNQPYCDALTSATERETCQANLKWCRQYTIKQAPLNVETKGMGMIPITNFCYDNQGRFSQEPGKVIDPFGSERIKVNEEDLMSCTYGDGTLVQRNLMGAYAACGGAGKVCSTVFEGGYETNDYDPRLRPWYIQTKELQHEHWTAPYPFFPLGIGVSFAQPIYTQDEETGRQVFAGVLAVDYQLQDIAQFLIDSYGNSSTAVVIYEDAEPKYLIGVSTGSASARNFLTSDLTQPCPVDRGDDVPCTPVRSSVRDIEGDPMDVVLVQAFEQHDEAGYPEELLSIPVHMEDVESSFYVSQSTLFEQAGPQLAWRVIIVAPGAESSTDSITKGDPLLAVTCLIGGLGFFICSAIFWVMFSERKEKAVIFADWRFTCAFIFGCILLNGSTFTLLGENTDVTCLLRMWTFHLFFAVALAPLFVKVWRINQLVGMSSGIRRQSISNCKAAMYTLPMVIAQAAILLTFTFVDPPKRTEVIENNNGMVVQRAVCDHETDAFLITILIFEAGFVLAGCYLAYKTRNLGDDFGEAKQLMFAMYNIAFVGGIIVLVMNVADMDGNGQSVLQAIGVWWGTVFSTAAFVLPRLAQVRQRRSESRHNASNFLVSGRSTVHISGLYEPTVLSSNLDMIEESEMEDTPSDDDSAIGPKDSGSEQELGNVQDTTSGQEHAPPTTFRVDWTGEPQSSSDSTLGSG